MNNDYTRVSDILKIFKEYEDVPIEIVETAAVRGSEIHSWISRYIQSKDDVFRIDLQDLSEEYKIYGAQFIDWYSHVQDSEIFSIEERFYDDELMITGQIDLILKRDNKYYLIDFKTNSAKNKKWGLQLAAYAYLVIKNKNISFEDLQIVHLKKDGKMKIYNYKFEEHFDAFVKCVDIYNYFNVMKKRRKKISCDAKEMNVGKENIFLSKKDYYVN